jgi:two-component system, OmpR family, alkaline phosphatase synthesis response regulator PhoP
MADAAKKRVLIVEDEVALCTLYSQVLKDVGYEVDTALEGEEGIKKVTAGNWDVLLLDIMLPKKDGLQILKEVRMKEGWKKGPIVLLTNLNSQEIIQTAFGLGADEYLIKSEITPDQVIAEVNSVLSK